MGGAGGVPPRHIWLHGRPGVRVAAKGDAMKQRWVLVVAVAVVSFFSGGWLLQRGAGGESAYQRARLFDDVLSHISNYYVDSLSEGDLYTKAARGVLQELKDPYSVLLQGDDFKALTETTTGNYGGLGMQIDVRDGWITVVAPLPDTPAERAGIQTGDQIVELDGKSTHDWKQEQAVRSLRGEVGSQVSLKVRRPGVSEPMVYSLTRATIHVRSVPPGTMFDNGVGYISLNPVSETSARELRDEIAGLQAKGMKSLVLDLRRNPGGLLDQGVKVADLFLNPQQEIVSTRGRARNASRRYLDEQPQAWPKLPVVVLVDEGTASAAEIISGALQDHDRAVVVGTPTFGKGLVQTLFPLGEATALKLTTARWYTPSGRTIQRTVKDEDDQMLQAMAEGDPGKADSLAQTDSALKARPVFKTDAGRTVRGGGGIVPDIVVRADTFTVAEREFVKALGAGGPAYRDVLTAMGIEAKANRAVKDEGFAVSAAMLEEVYRRLESKGVTMPRSTFDAAGDLVAQQLGYEITRYVFGRPAEFRRRAKDDAQLQKGVDLLRKASTPQELMRLATTGTPADQAARN